MYKRYSLFILHDSVHRQSVGSPVREGGDEYGHILTISEHMVD